MLVHNVAKSRPKWSYTGIDYSEFQLKQAKKLPFNFKKCNLEKGIPFSDEKFDVIYCGEVIEHLYNPDFLVKEFNRILKPNGHIIMSTPNLCSWFNRILFVIGVMPLYMEASTENNLIGTSFLKSFKRKIPVGHLRIFNKDAITDHLKLRGFKIIGTKGARFEPGFPKIVFPIDFFFQHIPSLSGIIIYHAQKKRKLIQGNKH